MVSFLEEYPPCGLYISVVFSSADSNPLFRTSAIPPQRFHPWTRSVDLSPSRHSYNIKHPYLLNNAYLLIHLKACPLFSPKSFLDYLTTWVYFSAWSSSSTFIIDSFAIHASFYILIYACYYSLTFSLYSL